MGLCLNMKIQNQNYNLNFRAGLTSAMRSEIKAVDAAKVSKVLQMQGIQSDFKNNKVLAWCSLKTVEIINEMNKRFGVKFGFPRGIYVEDFTKNPFEEKESIGFINFISTQKCNKGGTPEKTIYFNEFVSQNHEGGNLFWDNIDTLVEEVQDGKKLYTTDFFLEPIFHEFAHAIHGTHLLEKLSPRKLMEFLYTIASSENIESFQARNGSLLRKKLCEYAATSPMEAIACDLSKRTIECLNKDTLIPQKSFLPESPYKNRSFWDRHIGFKPENKLTFILRSFWNGKIPEYFSKIDMKSM